MGFRIYKESINAKIFINKKDFNNAFKEAKNHILKQPEFCRVTRKDIENSENLIDLISAMRWEAQLDSNKNIISIYNYGLNIGDELLLFESIAPFVKNNSYVEYIREGYSGKQKERYSFLNGKVTKDIKEV